MRKASDLTNQRFGKLVAIEPTEQRKNAYTVWLCRCDCGNEVLVPSRALRNGYRTHCGCVPRYEDLTGQRFGKLIVQNFAGRKKGQVMWHCQCDCGGTVIASSAELKAGDRKSCGCLSHPPLKDWVGKRFGKLTVVAYDGKRNGSHYWRCQCDCGNETVVPQSSLKSGRTKSCGCLVRMSSSLHFVEGTNIERIRNRDKLNKNNTSGVRGVYPVKKKGEIVAWVAQIKFKGKMKYLGTFDTLEEAADARKEAEKVFDEVIERFDREQAAKKEKATDTADAKDDKE